MSVLVLRVLVICLSPSGRRRWVPPCPLYASCRGVWSWLLLLHLLLHLVVHSIHWSLSLWRSFSWTHAGSSDQSDYQLFNILFWYFKKIIYLCDNVFFILYRTACPPPGRKNSIWSTGTCTISVLWIRNDLFPFLATTLGIPKSKMKLNNYNYFIFTLFRIRTYSLFTDVDLA